MVNSDPTAIAMAREMNDGGREVVKAVHDGFQIGRRPVMERNIVAQARTAHSFLNLAHFCVDTQRALSIGTGRRIKHVETLLASQDAALDSPHVDNSQE